MISDIERLLTETDLIETIQWHDTTCAEAQELTRVLQAEPKVQQRLKLVDLKCSKHCSALEYHEIKERILAILEALQGAPQLTSLTLSGYPFYEDELPHLGRLIADIPNLQYLCLNTMQAQTPAGPQALLQALATLPNLMHLNLAHSQRPLMSAWVEYLRAQPDAFAGLHSLDVRDTQLDTHTMLALLGVLRTLPQLRALLLGNNSCEPEWSISLADFLQTCPLILLDLASCQLQGAGLQAICEALQVQQTIQVLLLPWNYLRDTGAQQVAELLASTPSLSSLDLGCNGIGNPGVERLAKVLQQNTTLRYLNLMDNHITMEGAIHLADMLRVNQTLTHLELKHNPIQTLGLTAVARALYE